MFPHLPSRSRGTFRIGLAVLAAVLVIFCVLHWQVPMVVGATFAAPLLFTIYLVETGLIADLPRRVWLLTFIVGVAVGVAWAIGTTAVVADAYSLGLGTEVPTARLVRDAVIIPFGGLLALQLPVVLIRLTRPPHRDSLYGFVVGAIGATMFAAAATLVRLIPQLREGFQNADQPVADMLLEAGVRAVTMPVVAAAVGGLVGAALWYAPGDGSGRRRLLAVIGLGSVTAAAVYACVGLVEALRIAPYIQFLVHAAIALLSLLALRVGLQLAMLNERHETLHPELPIQCPECGHVVPDMAFCPACGVAAQASSRLSRALRRRDRPQPSEQTVHP